MEYRQPCDNPRGADEADLCAQWKAARAAEDAALWTKIGTVLSAISVLGIVGALALTVQSNTIAGSAARIDRRPWISVTGIELVEPAIRIAIPGFEDRIAVAFEAVPHNSGKTPAANLLPQVIAGQPGDPRSQIDRIIKHLRGQVGSADTGQGYTVAPDFSHTDTATYYMPFDDAGPIFFLEAVVVCAYRENGGAEIFETVQTFHMIADHLGRPPEPREFRITKVAPAIMH
ncbi:hypothetical protein ASE00_09890 [Sphingomonas sp. Root710]|nr:hypothetical protein ASE00_09890 [Sphingomonas sp. Root710]